MINREDILVKCWALRGKPYVDNFMSYILQYSGDTWNGTLSNIAKIRCDGVSEVSYENNDIRLWGTTGSWNIMSSQSNLTSHNSGCTPKQQRTGYTTNSPSQLYFP